MDRVSVVTCISHFTRGFPSISKFVAYVDVCVLVSRTDLFNEIDSCDMQYLFLQPLCLSMKSYANVPATQCPLEAAAVVAEVVTAIPPEPAL
jgi:hypothetical protein